MITEEKTYPDAGRYQGPDDIPDPLDNRVWITTLPAREVAVIRFKGYASLIRDLRLGEGAIVEVFMG